MKAKSEMTEELYIVMREFFITFSVQYGIFKCLNWEVPSVLLFLTSLLIVVTLKFANDYRMKKIILLLPIIFLLVILVLRVFFNINAFLFIKDALFWNYAYSKKIDEFNIFYCILTVCIISVVIMKIVLCLEKNMIAKFVTAVGLLIFMVICAMYNIQWNSFVVGLMLFCCLDIIVEIYQVKFSRAEKYSERCLVPFIVAAVLLAMCIPSKKEPIQWEGVKNTVNSIKDNIQEIVYNLEYEQDDEKNEFSVNKVGLSETKTNFLGNFIDEKGRTMLLVEPRNNMKIGYLSGLVRSEYTGNGWDKDKAKESNYTDEYKMDLYEKLYNLYYSDLKQFPNEYFSKRIYYKIFFDKISTQTVFRPENCNSIDNIVNEIDVDTVGDNVYFPKKETKGYYYYASALIMNMNNDNMKQYLEGLNENKDYYEEKKDGKINLEGSAFDESVNQLKLKDNQIMYITSDDFRKRLAERSKKIKEEYLQIPAETPDRVRNLAEEITKNYTNQYDKADAIYKYLKTNYTYETNLSELPKGKDAVDYFLFEKKSGYCTFFASSMAILCRSVYIPVRYVEGATINYKENDDDNYDRYIIKTESSHAWTEIYLEGFGWVRMDPTPGNYDNKINWAISDSKANLASSDSNGNQLMNKLDTSLQDQSNDNVQMNNSQSVEKSYSVVLWLKYTFIGVALLIMFILSGIGLFIWNQKMIYKKSNNRQKVLICMKKILFSLEKQGYELKQGETLKEFIKRLENDRNLVGDEILELLEWFQMVRYSKKAITEEEVFCMEQFRVSK